LALATVGLALVGGESSGQTTVNLTVSNKIPLVKVYGVVTLTQVAGTNTVTFTVTADPTVYNPPATAANFGISSFGFESSVALAPDGSDITFDPSNPWTVKQMNGSEPGFSTFDWVVQGNTQGTLTTKTLIFSVTHNGINPMTFAGKVNGQNADFAARIINFPKQFGVTSHSVANTGAHVAASQIILMVLGAGAVLLLALLIYLWKRRKAAKLGEKGLATV
jgi:hypothetical protein